MVTTRTAAENTIKIGKSSYVADSDGKLYSVGNDDSGALLPIAFLTIREEAAIGMLTECKLRAMAKMGQLPGCFCGTRFYINHNALVDYLNCGRGEAI